MWLVNYFCLFHQPSTQFDSSMVINRPSLWGTMHFVFISLSSAFTFQFAGDICFGEGKKFFVSSMGSVVTQHSARPANQKLFYDRKRVFIILLLNVDRFQKLLALQHFFFLYRLEISRGWLTREMPSEMSLSIKCLINFSILNHWRSTATNYYSFHQLRL